MAQSNDIVAKSPLSTLQDILSSETSLYVLKRVSQGALTLLLASALCFFIVELAPGN